MIGELWSLIGAIRGLRSPWSWTLQISSCLLFLCLITGHYVVSDQRTLITDRGDQRTVITLILDPSDFKLATFSLPDHLPLCSKWSENSDHWSGCDQRTVISLISEPSDFKLTTFSLPDHWALCSKWSENSDHWSGWSENCDHFDLGPFRSQTGYFFFAPPLGTM